VVTRPRASIVIRTFNEARHLPDLLSAIDAQTIGAPERETIIVDSGSTDATLRIALARDCRVLHIAREEFSFGRSLNMGCAAAGGEAFVFISGHCVPTSRDWLAALVAPIESGGAAIAYGRQVGGAATRFSEHQIFRKYYPPVTGAEASGFFCNNANAAIRRDVWESLPFDEQLTGLEDLDLGKRVQNAGGAIRYVPQAGVFHHHDESWSQVRRRFEREALALRTIMPEIHIGALTALRYMATAMAGDWRRAGAEGSLTRHAWPIAAYRFCQYYGAWKGNHTHRRLSRELRERYFYPHGSDAHVDCAAAAQGSQRESAGQELPRLCGQTAGAAHAGHAARDR
jgi:rhamnosyltransferase